MLVVIPLLVAGPVYDMALAYLDASQNLKPYVEASGTAVDRRADFSIEANFSLGKPNFADRYLTRSIGLEISGNYTPQVSIVYLSSDHKSWESEGLNVVETAYHPGTKVCGFDSCVTYSNLYLASRAEDYSADEWDQFGALNAPLDWYQTTVYCISLNGSYAFGPFVSLSYTLPPGYRAGIQSFVLTGNQITNDLARMIPSDQNRISCFRIAVARDPLGFLALVMYTTVPLIILWYVAVITFSSVNRRNDRLQIYVGALFASFAYFFSVRQYLQSIVTFLDVFTVAIMIVWILCEAGKLLLE